MTYSKDTSSSGFSVTVRAYHGQWHSSDQIAESALSLVGIYGTLNPTDGGHSQRYSLQGEWHRQGEHSRTKITAYGFYHDPDLFSEFTYYLTDLTRGDQFEQQDRRWAAGIDAPHHQQRLVGHQVTNTFGLQVRNDWIHNGLYQSQSRKRVTKTDSNSGNTLTATTQADRFTDTQIGNYAENRIDWSAKVRSVIALRDDLQHFDVTSPVTAANSGAAIKALPSPKASPIFGPWEKTEFYTQAGFGFHSNYGRGTTLKIEPVSADNPAPNTPATPIPALIPPKVACLAFVLRSCGICSQRFSSGICIPPRNCSSPATPEARPHHNNLANPTRWSGPTMTHPSRTGPSTSTSPIRRRSSLRTMRTMQPLTAQVLGACQRQWAS